MSGFLEFWCVYIMHLVLLRAAHQLVALRKQRLCCWSICFILNSTYLCENGCGVLVCVYTSSCALEDTMPTCGLEKSTFILSVSVLFFALYLCMSEFLNFLVCS